MKANNYISKSEHKLIVIISFVSVVLAFSNLIFQIIEYYTKPTPLFVFYDMMRPNLIPLFNFSTLFIFIALFNSKKYIVSSLLTLLTFIPFAYEFYSGFRIILFYNPQPERNFSELLFLIANRFDYLVFFLVTILLFWQISILLRMLIKTLQKEKALP